MPINQLDMFKTEAEMAAEARDNGMALAYNGAERASDGWNDRCYALLQEYVASRNPDDIFLCEDFRNWAAGHRGLQRPPSLRSFGSVMRRAIIEKLIQPAGYGHVKNIKAHCANALVYKKGSTI